MAGLLALFIAEKRKPNPARKHEMQYLYRPKPQPAFRHVWKKDYGILGCCVEFNRNVRKIID